MLAYLFVVFAVLFRIMPHTMGFAPVIAALLFFGSRMPRKQLWVPVLLLAGSDIFLTRIFYGYPLTPDHVASWLFYVAVLVAGATLGRTPKTVRLTATALSSSVGFFIISNFAVWAVWEMYPKTWEGLMSCYVAAIPFFRNAVAGDLFFTAVMFSIPALVEGFAAKRGAAEA